MKKLILFLSFLCFLGGIRAQEIKDSLFKKVLVVLNDSTSYIQHVGCIVDVDFQTKTPFTKKAAVSINQRFYLFLISDPFADEMFLMCRYIHVFDVESNRGKDWFVGQKTYDVLDKVLREAKLKTFTDELGNEITSLDGTHSSYKKPWFSSTVFSFIL